MSTPAGKFSFFNSSTVFAVGSMMSSSRLWVRISNCSIDFLSTCGERFTVNFSINVGSGIGPATRAPVRLAVSTMSTAGFDAVDGATTPAEIAADVALILVRRDVFDFHDRLEQNRLALLEPVFHGEDGRHLKREFAGINFVERAVNDVHFNINDGITAEYAIEHRFLDAFFDGRNVFARNDTADDFVLDDQTFAALGWAHVHFHVSILAAAP